MSAQPSADQPAPRPATGSPQGKSSSTERFGTTLTGWCEHRAMSKKKLAAAMGFDPSYISHVEAGRHPASKDFARKAETVLSAGGALWQAWRAESPARMPGAAGAGVEGLVVEEDHARLGRCTGHTSGADCSTAAPNRSPAT
jgi:Helix-turn-helix domain